MRHAWVLTLGLVGTACGGGDPERVLFFDVGNRIGTTRFESDGVVVAAGTTSWASIALLDADDRPLSGLIGAAVRDPDLLQVEVGPGAFFFTGLTPGRTALEVTLDGHRAVSLPAEVIAQPAE